MNPVQIVSAHSKLSLMLSLTLLQVNLSDVEDGGSWYRGILRPQMFFRAIRTDLHLVRPHNVSAGKQKTVRNDFITFEGLGTSVFCSRRMVVSLPSVFTSKNISHFLQIHI